MALIYKIVMRKINLELKILSIDNNVIKSAYEDQEAQVQKENSWLIQTNYIKSTFKNIYVWKSVLHYVLGEYRIK